MTSAATRLYLLFHSRIAEHASAANAPSAKPNTTDSGPCAMGFQASVTIRTWRVYFGKPITAITAGAPASGAAAHTWAMCQALHRDVDEDGVPAAKDMCNRGYSSRLWKRLEGTALKGVLLS